ncbi:hypothetical protein [Caballeronia sp. LZ001]|nr:hypothetical protein [Caballeronia sp. LZ001]MDR5802158.1 hypothetical protein [Caballeronia sp. LZ001]
MLQLVIFLALLPAAIGTLFWIGAFLMGAVVWLFSLPFVVLGAVWRALKV